MSAKQKAVEDIKKLARMFKGLIDVSEELEAMGSVEQATLELKAKHAKAEADAKKALEELESANFKVETAMQKASDVEMSAKNTAQLILKEAHDQADGILAAVNADTQSIVMAAQAKRDAIDAEVVKATGELKQLNAQIADKQAVMDELEARLNELKAKFN